MAQLSVGDGRRRPPSSGTAPPIPPSRRSQAFGRRLAVNGAILKARYCPRRELKGNTDGTSVESNRGLSFILTNGRGGPGKLSGLEAGPEAIL
jgi:hypothetical protein